MPTPTRDDFKGTPFADLPVDTEEDWNPSGVADSELMAAILGPGGDDWGAYKKANLAYAPGEDFGGDPPTQYNAYKLKVARRYPASDPKGTLKVNFRQLANRIAVLNGGRQGAELTEEARRQAYNHAVKYYAKIDREPPALRSEPSSEVERRMFDLETVDLRVLREEGQPPRIEGHGAVFNKWSLPISGYFRERILPGAFTKTLQESGDIPSLYNHDPNMVLGRTSNKRLELREDETGLWFRVTPTDTAYARDLFTNIEEGNVTGNSFGFVTVKDRWAADESGMTTRDVIEARLLEVGPVTFPAYPDTDVAVRHFLDWELRIGRRLQGKRLEQLKGLASNLKDAAGALEELISWASEDDDSASSRSGLDHLAKLERLRRRIDMRLKVASL